MTTGRVFNDIYPDGYTTALVTTSSGVLYAFGLPWTSLDWLRVAKSTDGGANWTELTPTSGSTIHGTQNYMRTIDAAIDGSDYIHVVSNAGTNDTRDLSYAKFNTANDTWSAWEQAAAFAQAYNMYCAVAIAVDSNSKPHILYTTAVTSMGATYDRAYYTEKTGATWAAPTLIDTALSTSLGIQSVSLFFADNNVLHAFYGGYSSVLPPYYRIRTGSSWGSEVAWTNNVLGYGWRKGQATSGSVAYRQWTQYTGGVVYENDATTGMPAIRAEESGVAIRGNVRVCTYVSYGSPYGINFATNSGAGWGGGNPVTSGSYLGGVHIDNARYFNNTPSGLMYALGLQSTYHYIDFFSFSVLAASTSQHAYICGTLGARTDPKWWVPTSGSCPTIIFAYQAQKATSQANSFVDLDTPGTYDASLGTFENWTPENGWSFIPIDYLNTGYTPTDCTKMTIIVRYTRDADSYTESYMWGADTSYGVGSGFAFRFSGSYMYWCNGGYAYRSPIAWSGVMGMAGKRCFLDGQYISTIGAGTYTCGPLFIGKETTTPTYTNYAFKGDIQAMVLYDGILTDQQVAEVSAAMLLFGEPGHGFSQHAYMYGTGGLVRGVQHAMINSGTYMADQQAAYMRGAYDALWPNADVVVTGGWINEQGRSQEIYKSIDEWPVIDDNDLIADGPAVNNDYYECALTDPIGPIGAGTISVKWRGRNQTSGSIACRIQLRQGSSTIVASRDQVLPTDPTTYSFDLTTEERALITDPTDLRMRFVVLR